MTIRSIAKVGRLDTMYYVYLLRCSDNSLYCGITNDLNNRIIKHNSKSVKGARYTRSRQPVKLVYLEKCDNKSNALKREIEIKKLTKNQKEKLITESSKISFSPNIKTF